MKVLETAWFQKVIDSLDKGIVILGADREILYTNPCAQSLLGIPLTEGQTLQGSNPLEAIPKELERAILEGLEKCAAADSRTAFDVSYSDSQEKTLKGNVIPLQSCGETNFLLQIEPIASNEETLFLRNEVSRLQDQLAQLEQAHEELRESSAGMEILSIFDELTLLYNRRYFLHRATNELDRAIRYEKPLGILILDLDHFKSVNDEMGHPFGDTVLRQSGMLLMGTIRMADIAARYGGEEFVVLSPETGIEGLRRQAERIRIAFEEYVFCDQEHTRHVTVSIGGCSVPPFRFDKPDDMLAEADKALYQAKKQRNKAVCCEPES